MALKIVPEKRDHASENEIRGEIKHRGEDAHKAKARFLRALHAGNTVKESYTKAGRTQSTYEYWRKTDADFRRAVDEVTAARRGKTPDRPKVPDFPEFCERYLGWRLYRHQLQWYDALEGREPRDLHPSQVYEQGRKTHMIINTPPYHAKTSTISVAYTLWRILKNPATRVILISKKQQMASDFIYQIKDFLTNPNYRDLQVDFGPAEGFQESCPIWAANRFYFGPKLRTEAMKDPTVQAIGMHGQLYGTRADLIILDDCIEPDNAHEYEKQINWLSRVVLTRPGKNGTVLVVGTRIAPIDLYGELRKPQYSTGKKAWTYFAQPAVEEFADNPEDWKTLWPKSNQPQSGDEDIDPDENGEYPAWDGPALSNMRDIISQVDNFAWAQGYQQEQVAELAVFPREDVYGCIDEFRWPGYFPETLNESFVVAGLDPASAGHTAAVVLAVDVTTGKRHVIDIHNQVSMTPDEVRHLMLQWTDKYHIREWRIEKVLLSNWITQDRELQKQLATRGVAMVEHHTGRNKWDADAGVMSMASLFKGWQSKNNLITLPTSKAEITRTMAEQLITYFPETKGKTDILMALWFAELRAREIVRYGLGADFVDSEWLSARDRAAQQIIDIDKVHDYISPWWN